MYAYNYHSPPPNIRGASATSSSAWRRRSSRAAMSLDEIIAGWAAKGATLGIREYYSVNTWDRDLPGHARGGNLDLPAADDPRVPRPGRPLHVRRVERQLGARTAWATTSPPRMLWDVDEAERMDALVDDFLDAALRPGQRADARVLPPARRLAAAPGRRRPAGPHVPRAGAGPAAGRFTPAIRAPARRTRALRPLLLAVPALHDVRAAKTGRPPSRP